MIVFFGILLGLICLIIFAIFVVDKSIRNEIKKESSRKDEKIKEEYNYYKEYKKYLQTSIDNNSREMFYCADKEHKGIQNRMLIENATKSINMVVDQESFLEDFDNSEGRRIIKKFLDKGNFEREAEFKKLKPKNLSEFKIFQEHFPNINLLEYIKKNYTNDEIERIIGKDRYAELLLTKTEAHEEINSENLASDSLHLGIIDDYIPCKTKID